MDIKVPKDQLVRTTFSITKEARERLHKYAESQRRTYFSVLRQAIDEFIEKYGV